MTSISRKERDKHLRKADILKAAVHVFATKGYHATTMSDIAKEAQYAVGTLYLYFKDKQSLYLTLIEEKVNQLIATVKKRVGKAKSSHDKLKTLVETQLGYFEENGDFFRIYFSERSVSRWTIKDKISKAAVNKMFKYLDYITNLIKYVQAENYIKKEFPPKKIAYFLASMINATIISWFKNNSAKKENLRGESNFILKVLFEGIGPEK